MIKLIKDRLKFIKKIIGWLVPNTSRYFIEKFIINNAKNLNGNEFVLDAGSGKGMYRQHFGKVTYESADFCEVSGKHYGKIDYVCDLESIPVDSERYDVVVCTQVLEHLPRPQRVLCELNRVLKIGGELWLTAPFEFPEHETPFDFYRYTQYGLKYLCEEAGFTIILLKPVEGYFGTLAHQLRIASVAIPCWIPNKLAVNFVSPILISFKVISLFAAMFFSRLDLMFKIEDRGTCLNYSIIAVKKLDK